MVSLTYVCFVSAKGFVRDLSANSSNIAFDVPLASFKNSKSTTCFNVMLRLDPDLPLHIKGLSSYPVCK